MNIPQFYALATLVSLFVFIHPLQSSNIRYVKCPSTSLLRHAGTRATKDQKLNPLEQNYIRDRRRKVVASAYQTYLDHVLRSIANAKDHDHQQIKALPDYVKHILTSKDPNHLPRTAFAASGGGYRATIYSSGILNAFDGRNPSSNRVGTGGLLQAADYLAGLSGGSWMVTALAEADFPTFQELVLTGAKRAAGKNGVYGGLLLQYGLFEVRDDVDTSPFPSQALIRDPLCLNTYLRSRNPIAQEWKPLKLRSSILNMRLISFKRCRTRLEPDFM